MPGNSQRRNRRTSSKKGPTVGSGGKRRQSLEGRGRTLPASDRPWHKAYEGEDVPKRTAWKQEKERRKAAADGHPAPARSKAGGKAGTGSKPGGARSGPRTSPGRRSTVPQDAPELLVGRNPVVEALHAHIPCTALYVAQKIEVDDRIKEALRIAGNRGIAILEVSRQELDRLTGGVLHQGIGLQVPPFAYESFEDLVAGALESRPTAPLLIALDGVTDPRNLGAVVRSAAAFGAHGLFLPERRSAGMTATAWRASAGAAVRMPMARVTNLTRALKTCQNEGFVVVGLDADGELPLYDLEAALDPLVLVVGSEGRGLSRLVGETCDIRTAIPISSDVESLNASVAAAVALAEVARRRAASGLPSGPPPAT
ncbi:MAG: 23S rRNA (guanosine(2251)-2'-O)-methyltransferase RlmB [Micromonosporaceae bacterium]